MFNFLKIQPSLSSLNINIVVGYLYNNGYINGTFENSNLIFLNFDLKEFCYTSSNTTYCDNIIFNNLKNVKNLEKLTIKDNENLLFNREFLFSENLKYLDIDCSSGNNTKFENEEKIRLNLTKFQNLEQLIFNGKNNFFKKEIFDVFFLKFFKIISKLTFEKFEKF